MTEIRVAWNIEGRVDLAERPIKAGLWFPDTPENRELVETVAEIGNLAYGPGSHWVEEREA